MDAEILKIDLTNPEPALTEAASRLKNGDLIIFPTDTLYGIGAGIHQEKAIDRIYRIKKRERQKPILILVEKPEDVLPLVKFLPESAKRLMARHWPGPLTLIFDAEKTLSPGLTGDLRKIGIRCPDSPILRRLLFLAGSPVTATSANRSGEPACETAGEAEEVFGDSVDLILDGGPCISEPSTVVDVTGEQLKIIRQGKLKLQESEGYI